MSPAPSAITAITIIATVYARKVIRQMISVQPRWETFLKGEPCSSTSAASERARENV